MKTCFKCARLLPLSKFYAHKQMADGHLNKCKDCARGDVIRHREANIEKIREYDRERARNPKRIAKFSEYLKSFRKTNPEKYRAHQLVQKAMRKGDIHRPSSCQNCGCECTPHGHHEDYAKPLDVIWVCSACHSEIHKAKRQHAA